MANESKNVNVNENENTNKPVDQAPAQEQPKQAETPASKPVKEKVTWKLGPISIDLNPKVAKALKIGGRALAAAGAVALGVGVGSKTMGNKKDAVIRSKNLEIDRLTADLAQATAPKLVDTIVDSATAVAEVVPDVIDTVAETVD